MAEGFDNSMPLIMMLPFMFTLALLLWFFARGGRVLVGGGRASVGGSLRKGFQING